ncbi:MAG: cupredoxin domain-containing protein [Gemmatimonadetes bacterium]|nr:cupredoxin domain-containing protein [Gemmatimonadota bacterium]
MRTTVLTLALVLGFSTVACDQGDEGPVEETLDEIDEATGVDTLEGEAEADRPAERVVLQATSYAYQPSAITVGPGDVRFVINNAADIVHGFEVEGHGLEEAIQEIPAGATDSLTVTFETPGDYRIYCPVANHEELGMTGTVTVQ